MTELPVPGPPARLPRRALLRGGATAGVLLGLAACAGPEPPAGSSPLPAGPSPAPSSVPGAGSASPEAAPPASPQGPATELVRAHSGRPEVALTFHGAGARALDRKVLEALAHGGAQVTVLAVGTWLALYPDAAKMVLDLGHELGNHTWSHRTMARLSVADQRSEIERCRDRIAELTGGPGAFFRQSAAQRATAEQLRLAGAAGYPRVLSYDLDSLDWTDPGPATVCAQLRKATAGSVVSMHLGHQGTLTAIPQILADLDSRGLRPVTATQLFA
ncbi:MAG TPA: polysaccharide deacetylase family protein [Pseudonocardia sp.]|uniref:polysaccharide deacetylase family protein n=1 Tax=Pseudonocardia sp. TaxID=60912 RepID=UPI002D19A0C5|nr:polysaccharide deacetylase family protein [Pseudonocardia sp.]HTF54344.1 polysaccharide deacetylase family protein [Pseudonocardia sp.]